jgi:outer membrane protein assembly factor BamB
MEKTGETGRGVSPLWVVVGLTAAFVVWAVRAPSGVCLAGDWPQWRYDAGRGAASPEELPEQIHLQWLRTLPEPRPAWPASQPGLRFDVSYSPVAAGGMLFVPSMAADTLTAYDAATGEEAWRFYADGPVRFAPIVDRGKVYFAADDGFLYCLDARQGKLLWRFAAGPYERWILGNERLISTWPIRGGPVLFDGTIYFTAGIWPFMGIFVHAVDAQTGRAVWTNSGEGSVYMMQPHQSEAFAGFAPCGYPAATAQGLIVPGGRTLPACYDLKTGRLRHFDFGAKKEGTPGSYEVSACGQWFLQKGQMFAAADGKPLLPTPGAVHDQQALYGVAGSEILAQALQPKEAAAQSPPAEEPATAKQAPKEEKKSQKGRAGGRTGKASAAQAGSKLALEKLWSGTLAEGLPQRVFLKAGSRLILGGTGVVAAVPTPPDHTPIQAAWKGTFEGEPWTMLAADGRLFVVTTAGRIYCFGARQGEAKVYPAAKPQIPASADRWPAGGILAQSGAKEGYAVLFGLGATGLAEGLLRASNLQLIAVDPDAQKVQAARRRLDAMGLYGSRFTVHLGDPQNFALPPYLASLAVVEAPLAARADQGVRLVQAVFHVLRPYGGAAVFEGLAADTLRQWVKQADLAGARVEAGKTGTSLVRVGPLPGAADWTHQYADAANSVVSPDRLAKAPLGLLWFGGPPNDEVLPRHGHGPAPQVAAGRLVIEGPDMLRALDIYTGRLLWQKAFPSLGKFYNSTNHQPGAGQIGSNYVTLADCVYVASGEKLLCLDAADGRTLREVPAQAGPDGAALPWGFLALWENVLLATQDPALYATAGAQLVALDRQTGQVLWKQPAKYALRHNAIAAGNGRVFCIDALSPSARDQDRRLGRQRPDYQPRLLALDARTGRELWSTGDDVFGTFLNYSAEHDVLLQAGSASRDRAEDEAKTGMVAYRGADGTVLWKDLQRECKGPCMLYHDTIITQGKAYALLSGQPKLRQDPLSGRQMEWSFERNYGCNTAVASEHLLTFRSAAAGYYDLAHDGGTGNFGGFKSGCTSNLVVAGGLLNAPEYTRTCTCRYQNQTSLAMVHDPRAEMWTFNPFRFSGEPVRRVGINFGAPGDRLAEDGTLWLDYPSRGGPSPDIPVQLQPEKPEFFCHHSSRIKVLPGSPGLSWVAASGVRNITAVTLTLSKEPTPQPRNYTVRLHFAEVDQIAPAERVFQVRLQDRPAAAEIDIAKQAGAMTALVKEFRSVPVSDKLKVSFEPRGPAGSPGAVLCGIEVVAEGW